MAGASKTVLGAILLSGLVIQGSSSSDASPDDEPHPHRTHHQHNHLSDEEHYSQMGHNPSYDHEAFLGQDAANEFDQLSPEESKARLAKIVDKIDADQDGQVTKEELYAWITKSSKAYVLRDVDQQWKAHNPAGKPKISWADYKDLSYAFLDRLEESVTEPSREEQTKLETEELKTYKEMLRRDERRWKLADLDGDDHLTKEEFGDFLHPEEAAYMRDVVVQETLEDIDKDRDGKVSLSEYVDDLYAADLQPGDAPPGSPEGLPEWVAREKEQFRTIRDRNGDGFLDRDEIREWIIPSDYDHSQSEAAHLIEQADADSDGALTKDEILDKYQLFVGSQATDYGEELLKQGASHDEF